MALHWLDLFTGDTPVHNGSPAPSLTRSVQFPSSLRHFRDLVAADPHLTESQLLNANNRTPYTDTATATADAVVGGGGILGLVYAIHLKTIMPHVDIAVFEKSASPQYKIGESTLSSFTRFLHTDVVHIDYLLRLLG